MCSQSQSLNLEQALGRQSEGHDQKQRILSSLRSGLIGSHTICEPASQQQPLHTLFVQG